MLERIEKYHTAMAIAQTCATVLRKPYWVLRCQDDNTFGVASDESRVDGTLRLPEGKWEFQEKIEP